MPRDRFGPSLSRSFFSGGAGLPRSSSFDGGFEELPELRDSRCSNLPSFPASVSFASISSEICDLRGDLPVLRGQLPDLTLHNDNQLIA